MDDEEREPARGGDPRLAALAGALGTLIEHMDDLALDLLREAVAAGERQRPDAERRLVRARNALARAQHLLEG
jgi:hypothetical protein